MKQSLRPTDTVILHIRNGDSLGHQAALITGVSYNEGLAGNEGEPAVEVVTVNPAALRHAGTSDWHHALLRFVSVVHISHKDFVEKRASIGYDTKGEVTKADLDSNEGKKIAPEFAGDTTQYNPPTDKLIPPSSDPDSEDDSVTGNTNDARKAVSDEPPVEDTTAVHGASEGVAAFVDGANPAMPEPTGSRVVPDRDDVNIKDDTEPGEPWTLFIDGTPLGKPLTEETNVRRDDGSLVRVVDIKEGDLLEGPAKVTKIEKGEKATNIYAERQ